MYKKGKEKKVQPICLYAVLDKGFDAAVVGYQLNETDEFKNEAENFAKEAEKFEKCLGSKLTTAGRPDYWKQKYEEFDYWLMLIQAGILKD